MTTSLRAGVATAVISPAVGTRLFGFALRTSPAESVRDELEATALVLDDGALRVAILACDLCFVHPTLLRRIRALVMQATGLPAEQLFVCCSHTHAGPVIYVQPGGPDIDRAYVEYLPYVLAGAVAAAARRLAPARLLVGHGSSTVGVQRRRPDEHGRVQYGQYEAGRMDPEVAVVRVEGEAGQPLATLVNYACHPSVVGPYANHPVSVGPESRVFSADYVGVMRRVVKDATGAPCLFVQGACADITPRGLGLPRPPAAETLSAPAARQDHREDESQEGPSALSPSESLLATLGSALGAAALAAREEALPVAATPLVARSRSLHLPLAASWSLPGGGDPRQRVSQMFGLSEETPPETVAAVLDERFPWASELVQDEEGRTAITVELGVVRCGGVAIVAISGEPFVETGLTIKAGSPIDHTLVAGYTNGCPGYLPPRYAYPEGGYEVDEAYLYYRLPAPPAPGGAERVSEEALDLLHQASVEA